MLRVLALGLSVLALSTGYAHADEIEATSKIASAVVYTNRATVTRQAVIDVPAGSHTLIFKNLPATLIADSLRTEGRASSDIKFGAVASKLANSAELSAARAEELRTTLETLQDQRRVLEAEQQGLVAKKMFIDSLGKQAALRSDENIAEIDLKPDQWSAAAQTIYTNISEIGAAQVQLTAKLRALDRDIAKAQSDLGQIGNGNTVTYTARVPFEASAATRLTVDLSYMVGNASWRPIYDARLTTETGKLELVQYGAVAQSTGEDWNGIKLSLSTAQPQQGATLPDLQPYWLDIFDGNFKNISANITNGIAASGRARRAAPMEMQEMAMDSAVMAEAPAPMMEKQAAFNVAQIETGGFVTEYKIPGPATVPADSTDTKLMVGTFITENKIQVQIMPQRTTDAFLVACAKLKGDSPILAGQVQLFRDGAYVGASVIPLLRPDEEQNLFFGTDDQVSVKRKVLKDEKSQAGMIVKDNTQERHTITEIQNLHTKPVEIVVKETIPTGRNDRIRSEIEKDATTSGYKTDTDNIKGLLTWQFQLEPKAKKDVKLGWTVSWPKDTNLTGL